MKGLRRFRRRLAFRMVFPFAASLVVVFATLTLYLGRAVRDEGLRELRDRASIVAEMIAHNAELPLLARDARSLQTLLEGATGPDLIGIAILDAAGTVVSQYSPPGRGSAGAARRSGEGTLRVETDVRTEIKSAEGQEGSLFALDATSGREKTSIGRVRMLVSTQGTFERTRLLQAKIAAAGCGLLLVCIGIGIGLVRVMGVPFRALVGATRQIAAGDLSVHVAPSAVEEIGELAEAFNRMAADLGVARSDLLAERLELQRTQETLFQTKKLTALGELVAGVAHEMNNPLASIMGYSQLLLAKDLPPEVHRRLETMFSEAERMAKIVKNLLTFARQHAPEKRHLGLNGIIEKTLELKAYHFRVSQIQVEKHLAPDLPLTMLDFHQMQQVLLNLLNNAEQAMREAGRGTTIRVTTRSSGDRIEARVADDGPGIPHEIQARIFEPFFTTKKEGDGTGLGLSLCYGIIQQHGGSIRVESRPGEGTEFIIELPVVQQPPEDAVDERMTASRLTQPLKILVVDDEPGVLDFLVDLLRSRGHKVDTASDVPEARRKIAANGHDLIISDMRMPRGSGEDVYKAVLEKSPHLARRVIFTTGDGAREETLKFLRETGNEILLKPYRIEDLEQVIASAIRT
ncbi:MAG: response regulator, partial [Candidatus Rokubacteria bacterium]|nr:response regulator [Candidatus Rokubacteria bacterium]